MTHYKDLGLSNTKEMFERAMKNGYAVPAYNFNNLEQLQAIVNGCIESKSPFILQVSKGARNYANETLLRYMAQGAAELINKSEAEIPMALHLDHGDSFEICKSCVDSGFSSVMIDGSSLSYEDNVDVTKRVVEYAKKYDVSVEGELGVLAGIEDEVTSEVSHYTDPDDVEDFVKKTGVDSLAISIGTSHGAYKFKVEPGQDPPPLRFDILEEVEKRITGFPIVLHGASSVLKEYVDMINQYGGSLEGAMGVSEDQLRKAAKSAVCKVNIDSDGRLVVTAVIRKMLHDKPENFDPRKYLGPARDELKEMIIRKNNEVLGSAGRY
ncbi:MAG: class II fructose-1,6-bisphosphate aldolase [Spirochaetales bacterium]|nr:class II fructose-1,6-bisphosphate aldolase [Spirochaetales bacterium]MCF7937547.1 class II fructose-1,6-bisphosphate aldolase [Spirochaetales bacterium]